MSEYQTVTPYYADLLPKVKHHYWEVQVKERDQYMYLRSAKDYSLWIGLRSKRGFGYKASVHIEVSRTETVDGVRGRVKSKVQDIMQLLEITPPPTKGFYLSHAHYGIDPDKWTTSVNRLKYPTRTDWEYKYSLITSDFEDLEQEFKELLSKATTAKGLPTFVTGMK